MLFFEIFFIISPMLDALRSTFYREPPPPVLILPAEMPKLIFGPWEIKSRLDTLKEQAEDYLVSLHKPTQVENTRIEKDKKLLMKAFGRDLNEKELKNIVRTAYGISVSVEIDPSQPLALANTSTNTIVLNPLCILKPSDFPSDLHPANWAADRLYIDKLIRWISEKFEIAEEKLNALEGIFNYYYLPWLEHPGEFHHSLNFAVAHEVGHLHYQHWEINWGMPLTIILTASLTALLWSQTSLIIALASVIFIFKIMQIAVCCLRALYYRSHEREADLLAIKVLNSTKGAEIFLETCMRVENFMWGKVKWYEKLYHVVMTPDRVFHLEHGSFKTRLAEIKRAHTLQIQSAQPLRA